jgi:hypothetical protein
MVINFPLRNAFLCPIGSDRWHFCFHLLPGMLWFPLLFLLTHWSLSNGLFNFQFLAYFLLLFLLLSSSFIALWSESMQGVISVFFIFVKICFVP